MSDTTNEHGCDDVAVDGHVESEHDQRSFAAATATIALISGELAFQFGTSGSVFFTRFLVMATLGIVAFVSTFVTDSQGDRMDWLVRGICLLPLAALLSLATDDYESPLVSVGQLVVLVSVPFILGVLAMIFGVDVRELPKRLQLMSIATILVVAIGSYAIGANHNTFFSCGQFAAAGAAEPDDCFVEDE